MTSSEIPTDSLDASFNYTVIVQRLTGTVKWFNNKAGFGFITVCEPGDYNEKDIFVHYTSIRVTNSQYKYLVQGEYVDFTLVKANDNGHEFQAMDVSGVKGGPIMCETRRTSVSTMREPRPHVPHVPHVSARMPAAAPVRSRTAPAGPPRGRGPPPAQQQQDSQEAAGADELLGFTKVQKKRRGKPRGPGPVLAENPVPIPAPAPA
jgi:CspA family cold shock protein